MSQQTANRPLDTVVELQRALEDLRGARDRLHGIPDWMAELHEEHSARKGEIDALTESIEAAGQERRAAEARAADLQERLRTFQAQIGQVRNQREYGALLQEIDSSKQQIQACEDEALEALERQEEMRKEVAEKRDAFTELDQRYNVELEKWEKEKPRVAEEAEKLSGRIDALRERLPRSTVVLFERIFGRYEGQALTEIQKVERTGRGPQIYHCGTCNFRVRPQAVVEIVNTGKIVPCDRCKKILYFAEVPG